MAKALSRPPDRYRRYSPNLTEADGSPRPQADMWSRWHHIEEGSKALAPDPASDSVSDRDEKHARQDP